MTSLFDFSSVLDAATIRQEPELLKSRISGMYCVDETRLLESLIPSPDPHPICWRRSRARVPS